MMEDLYKYSTESIEEEIAAHQALAQISNYLIERSRETSG